MSSRHQSRFEEPKLEGETREDRIMKTKKRLDFKEEDMIKSVKNQQKSMSLWMKYKSRIKSLETGDNILSEKDQSQPGEVTRICSEFCQRLSSLLASIILSDYMAWCLMTW